MHLTPPTNLIRFQISYQYPKLATNSQPSIKFRHRDLTSSPDTPTAKTNVNKFKAWFEWYPKTFLSCVWHLATIHPFLILLYHFLPHPFRFQNSFPIIMHLTKTKFTWLFLTINSTKAILYLLQHPDHNSHLIPFISSYPNFKRYGNRISTTEPTAKESRITPQRTISSLKFSTSTSLERCLILRKGDDTSPPSNTPHYSKTYE